MVVIRMAEVTDAPALLALYRPYIAATITFEYEVPTVEEFARRIAHTREAYPYLLCEEEGRVLGYAYAHRARERAAYQWDAELSVYVSGEAHGRGIGRALYAALMELVEAQGVRNFYGVITGENPRSIRFHEELCHHKAYRNQLCHSLLPEAYMQHQADNYPISKHDKHWAFVYLLLQ